MNNKNDISRFFKHSSIYAIGNVLNRIGAFLLLPIYTTHLGVAEYGLLEIFYMLSAVVSGVLAVGIAHATLRFYFEYDDVNDRNAVVSTNVMAGLLITTVGATLVFFLGDFIVPFVFEEKNSDMMTGFSIVLATMILELSAQVCLAYLRARELSLFYVLLSLVKLIVQVAVNSYMVIVQEAGVVGILFGNFIAVASGWLILISYTMFNVGIAFHWDKLKTVLGYSLPFLLATMVGIVSVNADRFMLNEFLGLEAVGIYALAYKLTMLVDVLVVEPFSKSYGSYRFSIMKNDNVDDIQKAITRYMALLVAIVLISIVYASHEVITIMSNPEYYTAVVILPVLIFTGGINLFSYIFQTGILYKKATKHMFTISMISCASIVTLNLVFIPFFGLFGACAAQVSAALVGLLATNYFSQRYLKIDYPYLQILKVLGITILFVFFGTLANELSFWVAIAVKIVLFMLLLLCLYFSGVLTSEDKSNLWVFVNQKLQRS